jgi:fimbrial chaperone protein
MMRPLALAIALFATLLQLEAPAGATSLRVAPVLLNVNAPTAASTIRVWNDANRPINVQIRVFRWTQVDGEDAYVQTKAVVASPPITALAPGGENLIRIVRTSKEPIKDEESYRLVVDELPDPARRQDGTVVLVVRHSIPVFFVDPQAAAARPAWTARRQGAGYVVTVQNTGAKRLKISNLALTSGGKGVGRRDGLVGYVLGNSTASWFVPAIGRAHTGGSALTISADSEAGRFDAPARLQGG